MTRINVGIDPRELPKKLLIAEHRELIRIPNGVANNKFVSYNNIPKSFTLNSGHVLFFLDKLKYLKRRYEAIYESCVERNVDVTSFITCFDNLPSHLYNDYLPKEHDRKLLIERISSKGFSLLELNERDVTL